MEKRQKVIATVINDVVHDQRMIRICTSLSKYYNVELWGRRKTATQETARSYIQRRFIFLFKKGPLFYLFYNLKIFVKLLTTEFDIIHAVDLDTLPAGYFASKLKGKRLVYDSHEYFTEVPELISRPFIRWVWMKMERFILPNLKYAITVSASIANEYKVKYGTDFQVVRNCPYLEKSVHKSTSEKYLLYQGALNKGRGLEVLIEAMVDLDINLKIAGTGDIDNQLIDQVEMLDLQSKVSFLGMLKPEELPAITQNAFLGINVSENLGLSYFFSLNNKYFDYLHAGLPAITNPFPEYQYLNEQYECCVFASASSQEIIKSVKLVLENSDLYQRLRKNCLIAREDLHWLKEEKILLDVYTSIE